MRTTSLVSNFARLGILILLLGTQVYVTDAIAQTRGRTTSRESTTAEKSRSNRGDRTPSRSSEVDRSRRSNEGDRTRGTVNREERDRKPVAQQDDSRSSRPVLNRERNTRETERRNEADRQPQNSRVNRGDTSPRSTTTNRRGVDREEANRRSGRTSPDVGNSGDWRRRDVPRSTRRSFTPERRYSYPRRHFRPPIHIDVRWPWEYRFKHGWKPRYMYRQVIFVDVGWSNRRRDARIDVRTYFRHSLRRAMNDRAEVDIYLDRIELFADGRYLGEIVSFAGNLDHIRAMVYRDGHVRFDRSLFLVGDPYTGFEMIATRYYSGYILDAYERSHNLRVGTLDLRRKRVIPVHRSRLFNPFDFEGFVPISLLPEQEGWLLDYGYESLTGRDYERYYDSDDSYNDYEYEDYDEPYSYQEGDPSFESSDAYIPLQRKENQTYRTQRGIEIHMTRDVELTRLE